MDSLNLITNNPMRYTDDAVRRSFETSPDTVYGVLVGLLVLGIIFMAWIIVRKDKKLIDLNVSTIEILKDLNTSLLLLKREIEETREHIEKDISTTRK